MINSNTTMQKTIEIDGLDIFYREAGNPNCLGKRVLYFPEAGAHPYKRDLNNLEFHILDTGHFALEEDLELIANYIRNFVHSNNPNQQEILEK